LTKKLQGFKSISSQVLSGSRILSFLGKNIKVIIFGSLLITFELRIIAWNIVIDLIYQFRHGSSLGQVVTTIEHGVG